MTVFGYGALKEAIKGRSLGWVLSSKTSAFIRRGGEDTDAQRGDHVTMRGGGEGGRQTSTSQGARPQGKQP